MDEKPEVKTSTLPPEAHEYLEDYEERENKWGFINRNNDIVINEKYDVVRNFHSNICCVNEGGQWKYIDTLGNHLFDGKVFRAAYNFTGKHARVQNWDGTFNYINSEGDLLLDTPVYLATNFVGNNAIVKKELRSPYELLNTDGTFSMPFGDFINNQRISEVGALDSVHLTIQTLGGTYLYRLGNGYLTENSYEKIRSGFKNQFIVKNSKGYALIEMPSGREIIHGYDRLVHDGDGFYSGIKNEITHIIHQGNETPFEEYSFVKYAGDSRFIYYTNSGMQGLLDSEFCVLTEPQYKQLYRFDSRRAAYMRDGLWGFIDVNGHELTSPQYGLIWPFHDHMSRVMFRQGVGIIDTNFQIVCPPGLGELRDFHNGRAAFRKQNF